MNGDLDDFRIYNRSLNKKEIKELYNEKNLLSSDKREVDFSNSVIIYPNPATYNLTIEWSEKINSEITIEITDVLGKKVKTENIITDELNLKLNLGDLPVGTYYVIFIAKNMRTSYKLIKL